MKLTTFTYQNRTGIGIVRDARVVDLAAAAPELPTRMTAFLAAGPAAMERARAVAESHDAGIPLDAVHLEAPVQRPPKILAVGLNYADHIEETGAKTPEHPVIFNKQSTAAHPPFDAFHLPRASDKLDYEGELALVIGRRCRHVPRGRAREVIAGYTIVNDVSVRDWQLRVQTMTMGKSFDTHCPMGPWIVTAEELPDPHTLELQTWVNGELRQHSNTRHLIFDCFTLVEHLSTAFTLEPGDVVATGTPSGVGIALQPRRFLDEGDRVRIAIQGIGEIENAVIAEPRDTTRIE